MIANKKQHSFFKIQLEKRYYFTNKFDNNKNNNSKYKTYYIKYKQFCLLIILFKAY